MEAFNERVGQAVSSVANEVFNFSATKGYIAGGIGVLLAVLILALAIKNRRAVVGAIFSAGLAVVSGVLITAALSLQQLGVEEAAQIGRELLGGDLPLNLQILKFVEVHEIKLYIALGVIGLVGLLASAVGRRKSSNMSSSNFNSIQVNTPSAAPSGNTALGDISNDAASAFRR